MAGKATAYQHAVDSYVRSVEDVIKQLNNFGDTALQVISGGTTDGADINLVLVKSDGKQDWGFIADVEDKLRRFVIGSGSSVGIMQYMCSVAIAIAMIFFLISVLQLVTEDRFTPEFLVKFFAKFVIAFCVILWSPVILEAMIDFGNAFVVDVAGKAKSLLQDNNIFNPNDLELLVKNHSIWHYKNVGWDGFPGIGTKGNAAKMEVWGIFEALPILIESVMLGLFRYISYALAAVVMFIVITRILELYVRGAFLPVAASLMSDDGWRGSGGRYFRKLMSLATQNAAIIMVANVVNVVLTAALDSIFTRAVQGMCLHATNAHTNIAGSTTIQKIANCEICLAQMTKVPIDLPVVKPMIICTVLCVAGLALMFKTASLMDDLWGAR